MKRVIVYGSQYGNAKRYAEKLAELTGLEAFSYDKMPQTADIDGVIYLGGLYAGGVKGLRRALASLPPDAKLMVATVGLADVRNPANTDNIKRSLRKQMPDALYRKAEIVHLRGGIDYAGLNWKHRAMMALLYRSVKKIPPEERTAEEKELAATYGQKVDFVDFAALLPIAAAIREWGQAGAEG